MSWTPNYGHDNVLSKIKLGAGANDVKYLKDADLRAIVEGFNEDIIKGQIGAMNEQDKFVYSQNIKSYVDAAVAGVHAFSYEVVTALPTPSAETMYVIYLIADAQAAAGTYLEYITVDNGEEADPRYTNEQIGSTQVDLSGYLTDINYVDNTHTLTETKGGTTTNVHTFGDLADANTASTSYTPTGTISPVTTISTVGTSASFTQGTDSFDEGALPSIDTNEFSGGDLTNVSVVLTEGSVELDSLSADIHVGEGFLYGGTWPSFSQGEDTFSAGTLPTKASDTFTTGTLPSKAADTFTTGTLPVFTPSSQSFATAGVTVAVDASDDEMLVFSAAGTSAALTPSTTFSQGTLPSFTEGSFNPGTLPSFTEGAFTQGTLPSFTQGSDSYDTTDANFPYVSESDIWAEVSGNVNYTSQEVSSITFDFTPASVGSEFFNPGTLPSFEQGEDIFVANSLPTTTTTTPTFTGSAVTITVSADASE